MKLSSSQLRRFMRIYDAYYAFAQERLGPFVPDASENDELACLNAALGEMRIWGKPELIDAFVAANPAKLNERDLRTAESWKYALYAKFNIVLLPRHQSIFMMEDISFEVRGLERQVDEDRELCDNATAFTVLLPFEDVIVHGKIIVLVPMRCTDATQEALEDIAREQLAQGRVLSTARELETLVAAAQSYDFGAVEGLTEDVASLIAQEPLYGDTPADVLNEMVVPSDLFEGSALFNGSDRGLLSLDEQLDFDFDAAAYAKGMVKDAAETDPVALWADDPERVPKIPPEVRRELASEIEEPIDWKDLFQTPWGANPKIAGEIDLEKAGEAERAFREFLDSHTQEEFFNPEFLERFIGHQTDIVLRPISTVMPEEPTLYSLLLGLSRKELELICMRLDVAVENILAADKAELAAAAEKWVRTHRTDTIELVYGLGLSDFKRLREVYELSEPAPVALKPEVLMGLVTFAPFMFLVYDGGGYVNIIPPEVRAVLADVDWDEGEEISQLLDQACLFAEIACELRGVDSLEAVYDEYVRRYGDELPYPEFVEEMLHYGSESNPESSLRCVDLGRWYGTDQAVFELWDDDGIRKLRDEARAAVAYVRPVEDGMLLDDGVLGWAASLPEGRALQDFLALHAPDVYEDAREQAYEMALTVADMSRGAWKPADILQALEDEGLRLTRSEFDELRRLLRAFARVAPRWILGGWSVADLEEGRVAPGDRPVSPKGLS